MLKMDQQTDKVIPMKDQNALITGDGKVYKIQKVRQRKIHSCVPCHQRKVKCSRETPVCSNCLKNQLECKYFVNDRVSRGKKVKDGDKEADLQRKEKLKQYIAKAKIMQSSISPSSESKSPSMLDGAVASSLPSPKTASTTPTIAASKLEKPRLQTKRSKSKSPEVVERPLAIVTHASSGSRHTHATRPVTTVKEKSSNLSDSDSLVSSESLSPPKLHNLQTLPTHKMNNPNMPEMNIASQQNNPSFNNFTPFQTQQILQAPQIYQTPQSQIFEQQQQQQQQQKSQVESCMRNVPPVKIPTPCATEEEQLFQALPSKDRCYTLVKRFISTIHPILPILDINEFLAEHDLFWNNRLNERLTFLTSLFPILYVASRAECFQYSYDEITEYELSNEIQKFLIAAKDSLKLVNYPSKYSLRVLQSAVMLQSVLENPSIADVAILIRIAQTINLHRDPASYHNITDAGLVQLRRLLWWQIFYLDAATSLSQLCTPLIKSDEFDTSLPMEFVNNVLHCETCFLNGKFRYALILNELTRHIYGISILPFNTIEILKEKILDLHISCNASILNLKSAENSRSLTFDETNFINWSKFVLNSYCDRAVLLLQKKIILSNVLNTNEANSHNIFEHSYNHLVNNKRSKFSIDTLLRSNDLSRYMMPNSQLNHYSYSDLSNNLIPAALHYLYEFLKNNNNDVYNCFNWEVRNNLPFDSILLILTNVVSDLEKNHDHSNYELRNDIRFYLLDKSLDLIFIKFDNKKRSTFKNCFTLMRYLFQILRVRFLTNDNNNNNSNSLLEFNTYTCDQIIPKPVGNSFELKTMLTEKNSFNKYSSDSNVRAENSLQKAKQEPFRWDMQTTSCSQIAPRTIRAIAASDAPVLFDNNSNSGNNETSTGFMDTVNMSDEFFVDGIDDFAHATSTTTSATPLNEFPTGNSNSFDTQQRHSYKEQELKRIKLQIQKFLNEERLSDDDEYSNQYYSLFENEVKELIERFI